ncbi:MAG: hypothetical protein LAP40_07920 [Acidobacteriia bacterium]|nr:hypothetical protein [Terriglobia bacterium]
MDNSRDSSVWRSLAVAFGDGLAFGVGMKLTQNAAGKPGAPAPSDFAGRLARIEQRMDRAAAAGASNLDPGVLDAMMHALEARLQENAGLVDRSLAELEVKLAMELNALRQQDQALASATEGHLDEVHQASNQQIAALRKQVNDDRSALQAQVVALHREFAAAVADIVEEQVANQVEQRVAEAVGAQLDAVEQRLREEIRQAASAKHREIADLRQRITENDRNVLDVLLTVGDQFRQAAGRLGAPPVLTAADALAEAGPVPADAASAVPEPPQGAPPASEPDDPPSLPPRLPPAMDLHRDSDLPGFAQPRKASAVWNIPLVTSFVITAGCFVVLQYL